MQNDQYLGLRSAFLIILLRSFLFSPPPLDKKEMRKAIPSDIDFETLTRRHVEWSSLKLPFALFENFELLARGWRKYFGRRTKKVWKYLLGTNLENSRADGIIQKLFSWFEIKLSFLYWGVVAISISGILPEIKFFTYMAYRKSKTRIAKYFISVRIFGRVSNAVSWMLFIPT